MTESTLWHDVQRINVVVDWDGHYYRARCAELDLVSTGKTVTEAKDAMWIMIQQYMVLTSKETQDLFEDTLDPDDISWDVPPADRLIN